MNKLEQLARESTDLNQPDSDTGSVFVSCYGTGTWEVNVHVYNEFAYDHCDRFALNVGVIAEHGRDLDTVIDRVMVRVQDAVADTPCEQVA